VRLISPDGKQIGIVPLKEAFRNAEEYNLDLVEISPTANPPVCKIMDYDKFRYKQQMKGRESKKKQHVVKIKEVRFRPRIGEHDLDMKIDHIRKFLADGFKIKVTLMFRGRELAHQEAGVELVNKIIEKVSDIATIDKALAAEGRTIVTYLTSK